MQKHAPEIGAAALRVRSADGGIKRQDRRVLANDLRGLLLIDAHLIERNALLALGLYRKLVIVRIRNETLRNSDEQISRRR